MVDLLQVIFLIELAVRLIGQGTVYFTSSKANLFDALIVIASFVATAGAAPLASYHGSITVANDADSADLSNVIFEVQLHATRRRHDG